VERPEFSVVAYAELLPAGKLGHLGRRDVEIHHEPESWTVEARHGRCASGTEGVAQTFGTPDTLGIGYLAVLFGFAYSELRQATAD
jgi:hypothetical protein